MKKIIFTLSFLSILTQASAQDFCFCTGPEAWLKEGASVCAGTLPEIVKIEKMASRGKAITGKCEKEIPKECFDKKVKAKDKPAQCKE